MIFFHTKFRMLLDWTASRIQFHQTNLTNVAKFLMLQIFLNIRHKLFEFQTFMNQTQSINSTDIIIYFTDTYYLYYGKKCPKPSRQAFTYINEVFIALMSD